MNETNPPATDRPVLNVNTQRIGMANSANVVASIGSKLVTSIDPSFPSPPSPAPSGSNHKNGK